MLKKFSAVTAVVIAAVLILSFTGCFNAGEKIAQRAIEKAIEKAGDEGLDVDLDEGEIKIKGEDGSETEIGESASLPDGWPGDLAVYPDLNIVFSSKTKDSDGKNNWAVTGEVTKGSAKDVYEWYKGKGSAGWEITTDSFSTSDNNDSAYLSLESSKYNALIICADSDDTVSLTVTITEK